MEGDVVKTGDIELVELTNPNNGTKAVGWRKVSGGGANWIDDLTSVLPSGSKAKIIEWISKGLDEAKLKIAFNNSTDKLAIFNRLSNSKGIYHQRTIINDYLKIPGVKQASFVSNSVDNVNSNIVKNLNNSNLQCIQTKLKHL